MDRLPGPKKRARTVSARTRKHHPLGAQKRNRKVSAQHPKGSLALILTLGLNKWMVLPFFAI